MQTVQRKDDSQIQTDVIEELRWDTRVDHTDVGVEVDSGIVTLTGSVDSYAKRLAAQEAAHRVGGVLDVANDIQVVLPGSKVRTDTDIAHAIRNALEWDVRVPHEEIQTSVSKGVVTLEGAVDHYHQKEDAEWAVRNLEGVIYVSNRIHVRAPSVKPEQVKESIEQALERRAERAAHRVIVTVEDGKVILNGVVDSFAEKQAIHGAARFAPGVQSIEDNLRIDSHA
jgi:osmotically-inducible protein OsmY